MLDFDPTEVVLFSSAWFVGLLGQMFSELCPIPSSPLPFLCPPAWLARASSLLFDGKLLWKGTWNPQCLQAQGAGSAWEFTSSQGCSLTNDWQTWSINIFVLWRPSRDNSEMCVLYCFSVLSHCTNSHFHSDDWLRMHLLLTIFASLVISSITYPCSLHFSLHRLYWNPWLSVCFWEYPNSDTC